MHSDGPSTHASLFQRLNDPCAHRDALDDFCQRYYRFILDRCGRLDVNRQNLEDLAQEVIVHLIEKIGEFIYDRERSFRGWLAVIAHNKVIDVQRKQGRTPGVQGHGGQDSDKIIDNLDNETTSKLPEECLQVLETLESRVKDRIKETTWRCYELVVKEKLAAKEVAKQAGISTAKVYQYKKRVLDMLFNEVKTWKVERGIWSNPEVVS